MQEEPPPQSGRWKDLDHETLYRIAYEVSEKCVPKSEVPQIAGVVFLKIVTAAHRQVRFTNLRAYIRRAVCSVVVALGRESRTQPRSLGHLVDHITHILDADYDNWRHKSRRRLQNLRDKVATHLPTRQLEMLDLILDGVASGHELARRMNCSYKDSRRRFGALKAKLMASSTLHDV